MALLTRINVKNTEKAKGKSSKSGKKGLTPKMATKWRGRETPAWLFDADGRRGRMSRPAEQGVTKGMGETPASEVRGGWEMRENERRAECATKKVCKNNIDNYFYFYFYFSSMFASPCKNKFYFY